MLFYQLVSYGWLSWLAFAGVAFTSSFQWRLRGFCVAVLVVCAVIVIQDLCWIRSEMSRPGWDGVPDQDGIFLIGVLIRCTLVSVLLIPIGVAGRLARRIFPMHRESI